MRVLDGPVSAARSKRNAARRLIRQYNERIGGVLRGFDWVLPAGWLVLNAKMWPREGVRRDHFQLETSRFVVVFSRWSTRLEEVAACFLITPAVLSTMTKQTDMLEGEATNYVGVSWFVVGLGVLIAMAIPELGGFLPVAMIFAGLTSSGLFSCASLWLVHRTRKPSTVLLHAANLGTVSGVMVASVLELIAQQL